MTAEAQTVGRNQRKERMNRKEHKGTAKIFASSRFKTTAAQSAPGKREEGYLQWMYPGRI